MSPPKKGSTHKALTTHETMMQVTAAGDKHLKKCRLRIKAMVKGSSIQSTPGVNNTLNTLNFLFQQKQNPMKIIEWNGLPLKILTTGLTV